MKLMRQHTLYILCGIGLISCLCFATNYTEKKAVHTVIGPPEPAVQRASFSPSRTREDSVTLTPAAPRDTATRESRDITRRERDLTASRARLREIDTTRERTTEPEQRAATPVATPRVTSRTRDRFVDMNNDGYDDSRTERHDL